MGAWGYEPWQNDTASEFFMDLNTKKLPNWIKSGLESRDYHEQIAVAWFLSKIGYGIASCVEIVNEKIFSQSIKCLQNILQDTEWCLDWTNPRQKRRVLNDLIKDLEKVLRKIE